MFGVKGPLPPIGGGKGPFTHPAQPEGWLVSADHYAALPVTGFGAHDSPVTSPAPLIPVRSASR
jgi:hypothetical protein